MLGIIRLILELQHLADLLRAQRNANTLRSRESVYALLGMTPFHQVNLQNVLS